MSTTERDQQIADLYREGKGQRAIAREVGISQPAVRKSLLRQTAGERRRKGAGRGARKEAPRDN